MQGLRVPHVGVTTLPVGAGHIFGFGVVLVVAVVTVGVGGAVEPRVVLCHCGKIIVLKAIIYAEAQKYELYFRMVKTIFYKRA